MEGVCVVCVEDVCVACVESECVACVEGVCVACVEGECVACVEGVRVLHVWREKNRIGCHLKEHTKGTSCESVEVCKERHKFQYDVVRYLHIGQVLYNIKCT